jgi:hypothetical protein
MRFFFTLLLLFLTTNRIMLAQSDRTSITGTVRDTSGAVIPGARVSVTNASRAFAASAGTNELGAYEVLDLPAGPYALECAKTGFGKYERSDIHLAISQTAEIDVVLAVGASSETLTVTADAPLLQAQSSSLSTNLNNVAVTELPLNVQGGRNLSTFIFAYVPGVEGTDYNSHILGSLAFDKEVMIDGTSAVSQIGGYLSESSPPMEAVQEFQATGYACR